MCGQVLGCPLLSFPLLSRILLLVSVTVSHFSDFADQKDWSFPLVSTFSSCLDHINPSQKAAQMGALYYSTALLQTFPAHRSLCLCHTPATSDSYCCIIARYHHVFGGGRHPLVGTYLIITKGQKSI